MEVECLSSVMKKGEDNTEFSGVTVAVDQFDKSYLF